MSFADFFLCHAPNARYPPEVVTQVYHDGTPRFFGSIILVDLHAENFKPANYGGINLPFLYHHPEKGSQFYIILLDKRSGKPSIKLFEELERMALWYSSYLHSTANLKTSLINWELFDPFSTMTPYMRVIHLIKQKKWICSFAEGIVTFPNEPALDEFLEMDFGISKDKIETGVVNDIE